MPETDHTFFRIKLLCDFLEQTNAERKLLLEELVSGATDPTVRKRRFRMLHQLSLYEAQIVNKIATLETEDPLDFLKGQYQFGISSVVHRSG